MDKQSGRKAMIWSVVVLHIWGTILVWTVYKGGTGQVIADMFHAIGISIVACLAVLSGDKGLMKFVDGKFSPREEIETTTKTTTIPEKQIEPPA